MVARGDGHQFDIWGMTHAPGELVGHVTGAKDRKTNLFSHMFSLPAPVA
jgi:hypothetical protein